MDVNVWGDFASARDSAGARRGRSWKVRAPEGLLDATVKFDSTDVVSVVGHVQLEKLLTQETPPSAFNLVPKAAMWNTAQAAAKFRGELDGIRWRWKVLVMVIANNPGDRVGRSHWEENFRRHYRDDVYVCGCR